MKYKHLNPYPRHRIERLAYDATARNPACGFSSGLLRPNGRFRKGF